MENIYQDIAARTNGNIYIGVVGPVRTGKSTLIKRIMETLVIPNIGDIYRKERAKDELPQSGSGKTIMTSEPKFVPEEAVEICPDGTTSFRVRMIDSVGYMVDGAVGATEEGIPRMVTTPWYDYEIPMTEAAELGTQKVMQEHCSIGLVVTTD
jgi:stage IV sporulation protein A